MKSVFKPIKLHQVILAFLLPIIIGIGVIYGSQLSEECNKLKTYAPHYGIAGNTSFINEKVVNLSSADFSLTHKQAKNEGVERPSCSSLQSENLIRSNIFDVARIVIHSKRLTWFSQSEYLVTLAPLWHPSIPIAHRKLVI